jgi:hypothetical protein
MAGSGAKPSWGESVLGLRARRSAEEFAIPHLFGTPEHWLSRAKEARDMAAKIADAEAKRAMLEIAMNYDKLAKRAEAREAGIEFPPQKSL